MAYEVGRPSRLFIRRDIRKLIRTFPKTYVTIKRLTSTYNDLGEQDTTTTTVYTGEALVRPQGGSAETYGLGTVENGSLVLLINGKHDIRQADIVTINNGREYEVQFPPVWFDAFMSIQLDQRSQIGQPNA